MDEIIKDKEEYLKQRANPNDRLTRAHAAQAKPSAEELKELKQDLRANTKEGKENYENNKRDVNFAVANNLPASHRLRLTHEFDDREKKLLKLHREHKLTPIKE